MARVDLSGSGQTQSIYNDAASSPLQVLVYSGVGLRAAGANTLFVGDDIDFIITVHDQSALS
jgi:hypothetical protein